MDSDFYKIRLVYSLSQTCHIEVPTLVMHFLTYKMRDSSFQFLWQFRTEEAKFWLHPQESHFGQYVVDNARSPLA